MDTLSLTEEARIYNGLKTISLTGGAGRMHHENDIAFPGKRDV